MLRFHVSVLAALVSLALAGPPALSSSIPIEAVQEHFTFAGTRVTPRLSVQAVSPGSADGDQVSDSWSYVLRFADGTIIQAELRITDVGPGEDNGIFLANVVEPDGTHTTIRNTRSAGRWTNRSGPEAVELEIAHHTLHIAPDRQRLYSEHPDQARFAIDAEPTSEIYDPGSMALPGGHWYHATVYAPRLRAEGWLEIPGSGRRRLSDGRGIAIHTRTDLGDDKLATAWLRIDTFGGADEISLFELMTSRGIGQRRVGFLLHFQDDRLVGHTQRYGRKLLDTRPDPDKSDYRVPGALRFGADSEVRIRAEATLELVARSELLDSLNSAVLRSVLRMLSDPVFYLFRASYALDPWEAGPAGETGEAVASLYLLAEPPVVY